MAIKYQWDCRTVDTYPTHSDDQDPINIQSDVIYNVHWRLNGELIENEVTHSATVYGTKALATQDLSSFTSFDSLTHDQIVGWTTGSFLNEDTGSIQRLEESVSSSIALKINPTSVTRTIEL